MGPKVKFLIILGLLASSSRILLGQEEGDLTAKQRLFPGIGPGLRAVRRGADGPASRS